MKEIRNIKRVIVNMSYLVAVVVILIGYPSAYYASSEKIKITITDKERITTGSGKDISSKFIVYSENEVFENTDSWMYLKFNSADVQNKVKIGKTYTVKVAGWRVPFLSWYRNIINIENKTITKEVK